MYETYNQQQSHCNEWSQCRYAYVITCNNVVKEGDKVVEVHVEGRKVKEDEKPPKVSQLCQFLPRLHAVNVVCAAIGRCFPIGKQVLQVEGVV